MVWLLFAALTLVPFILALPDTWRGLEAMASDSHSGIPSAVYAWVALGLICLAMLVAVAIALILFLRRSDNVMVLLAGAFIMVNVTSVLVATNTSDILGGRPSLAPGARRGSGAGCLLWFLPPLSHWPIRSPLDLGTHSTLGHRDSHP